MALTTERTPNLRALGVVLAAASGLTVANLYYAQPLLDLIAQTFGVGQGTATTVVTLTQLGYVAGLLFVLPVGDLVENRTLITRTLIATAVALVLAAVSPVFGVFLAASVLVGVTSVVAQIVVPLAAHLAPEAERGRFVGRVMSGLLIGILLARTVASLVADAWGWRAIYVISAVLTVGLGLALHRFLPERQAEHTAGYRALLRSVVPLVREEPVLRRLAITQACLFGAFSAFWTGIAYELVDDHGLSQTQIGLFALAGAAGAAAAPIAGRVADRGHGRIARLAALVLAVGATALAGLGQASVLLLALAGVLLDFAVQSHHVMSQHVIYSLRADARSRINTVYMSTLFIGGAVSSAAAGLLHDGAAWTGVCWYAGVLAVLGVLLWLTSRKPAAS